MPARAEMRGLLARSLGVERRRIIAWAKNAPSLGNFFDLRHGQRLIHLKAQPSAPLYAIPIAGLETRPMTLNRIRLELGRTAEFPQGSHDHGYELIAPLTKDSLIDGKAWKDVRDRCEVIRFWGGDEAETGKLRRVGSGWRIDYTTAGDEDDEPFFKLDRHALKPGAYVSITEHDGVQRPFKIVSVTPVSM